MLFFKAEGVTDGEYFSEDKISRRERSERVRAVANKSSDYNRTLKGKTFFFVSDIDDDIVDIGAICSKGQDFQKYLPEFLKKIGLELRDTRTEETTFDHLRHLLNHSEHEDFIDEDADDVLERFRLNKIGNGYRSEVAFGENIIDDAKKEDIYNDAVRFLAKESFVPELDRIYAGKKLPKAQGHPVHYMIQTDSNETRKEMYKILLRALYANGRLQSRRYCFVDFRPGERVSRDAYGNLYHSCISGTIVVRYNSNDDREDDHASADRETVEVLCDVMKQYNNQVLTVFCFPRECSKTKQFFYENLADIGIIELTEEFAYGDRAKDYLKMLAKDNNIRTDKKLFAMVEEDKGYLAPDLQRIFDKWYNKKLRYGVYPQYSESVAVKRAVIKEKTKGSAYDELMEMIGIDKAKHVIKNALAFYKAQRVFADKGMKKDKPAMHMVFTGNPGTAKTTVARLFAGIMKENALLSKGHLVEVGRGDLVGKYVGWTAPTIQNKFREAKGGVLFIDEAYSLVDDRDGLYGDEAINTIVQEMENHREDVIVIFAGYPDKMEGFLNKNPGLRSRIAFHVPFDDYETDELCDIARLIAKKKGLWLTDDACERITRVCVSARAERDFGNGRFVRNIIEKAKMAQAVRLLEKDYDQITEEDVATICAEDIEIPQMNAEKARKVMGFRVSE